MQDFFYRFLMRISSFTGAWFLKTMAWWIATAYFVFFPQRVMVGVYFYRALFPSRGFLYHLFCTWRQFHNFTSVFSDRWIAHKSDGISFTREGWENVEKILISGKGGILLMSHLGNWELGANYLATCSDGVTAKLLLYLGEKQGEEIEKRQKDDLAMQGVRIIATRQGETSPFDLVEGIRFLNDGGLVSMTGDRLWNVSQRSVEVDFLGHKAHLPEAPFQFALLSGAPLIVFFVNRTGSGHYHCSFFPSYDVISASRNERAETIRKAAQHYADLLEITLKRYPFEWYHFERFLQFSAKI